MNSKYESLLRQVTPTEKRPELVLSASYKVGAFDSHLVDCPCPFRYDGAYRMIFLGFDGIGYQTGIASSSDLVNWGDRRLLVGRGSEGSTTQFNFAINWVFRDSDLFGHGDALQIDGHYVATYHTYPKPGYEAGPGAIGLCRSRDFKDWKIDPPFLHSKDGAEWERGGLYKSCLIEHDGRYYVFYNAKDIPKSQGQPWIEQTGLVTSEDLVHWERHPASPVLPVGDAGSFDDRFASDPYVLRANDTWVMFYFGLCSDGHAREGVAFSDDLIHWEKAPKAIIDVGPEGSIDSRYAHKPAVMHRNGTLYHYYCAAAPEPTGRIGEIATGERRGIALATNPTGIAGG